MKKITATVTLLFAISGIANVGATPPVNVNIYSGHSTTGGGTPYSNLVGSLKSTGVNFATSTSYNWHPFGLSDFGANITGLLQIPSDGTYAFTLNSDDGSLLYIDGVEVVDNGGPHSPTAVTGSAPLTAGTHTFAVKFFEAFGGPSGVDLTIPTGVTYGFAGKPANANCHGKSVSELAKQFGGIAVASSVLGFTSVEALQDAIKAFCEG